MGQSQTKKKQKKSKPVDTNNLSTQEDLSSMSSQHTQVNNTANISNHTDTSRSSERNANGSVNTGMENHATDETNLSDSNRDLIEIEKLSSDDKKEGEELDVHTYVCEGGCPCSWNGYCSLHNANPELEFAIEKLSSDGDELDIHTDVCEGGCPCSWNGYCSLHNANPDLGFTLRKEVSVQGGCPCSWNAYCSLHNTVNPDIEFRMAKD
eukprot:TRINITY_DN2537_c0_g1_i2.p1 TRINITY_DN2537_c0_g1~~TRINITY_DN2537_c0_g1_i2.p1  ORF type:complete len:209 (+),score=27.15 TRINITY_DN2537_c0_g1_i2:313-939(+)